MSALQLPNEPVMRRITTDKATKRTRQILSETEWVSLVCFPLVSNCVRFICNGLI